MVLKRHDYGGFCRVLHTWVLTPFFSINGVGDLYKGMRKLNLPFITCDKTEFKGN